MLHRKKITNFFFFSRVNVTEMPDISAIMPSKHLDLEIIFQQKKSKRIFFINPECLLRFLAYGIVLS